MGKLTKWLLLGVVSIGCAPPALVPPPSTGASVAGSPQQIVQRAASWLTADGFTITVSDAAGGVVVATRQWQGKGDWGPYLACRMGPDSVGRQEAHETLTVRVAAASADNTTSRVVVGAQSQTTFNPGMFERLSGTDKDCVSSGEVERRIVASLASP